MTQPSKLPRWSTDSGTTTEPTEAEKDDGFVAGQKPPAQYHNWLFNTIYQWCDYLKNITSEVLTWTGAQTFTAPMVMHSARPTSVGSALVYGYGNKVLFAGSCSTNGGISVKHSHACTLTMPTNFTVRVDFNANYTDLNTNGYMVLAAYEGPNYRVSSTQITFQECVVSNKTSTGFNLSLKANTIDLTGPTVSADFDQNLNSIAVTGTFSFVVLGPLVNTTTVV